MQVSKSIFRQETRREGSHVDNDLDAEDSPLGVAKLGLREASRPWISLTCVFPVLEQMLEKRIFELV